MKNYNFFFFWDYSKRSHQSDYIYYHKNMRENKLISSVETWLYRPLYYVLNFTRSSHIVNSRMVLLSTHAQNNKRTYTRKDFVGIHRYKKSFTIKIKREMVHIFTFNAHNNYAGYLADPCSELCISQRILIYWIWNNLRVYKWNSPLKIQLISFYGARSLSICFYGALSISFYGAMT